MVLRLLPFVFVLTLAQVLPAQEPRAASPPQAPASCPVTTPADQAFVPPAGFPAKPSQGWFWFGTDELWTMLPASGTWSGLPHYTASDPRYRQKIGWWREGYDSRSEPSPPLTLTGRRLDGPAPLLAVDVNNAFENGESAMVSGVFIPTLGCWQISGRYQEHALTFVVWVAQ